METIISAMRAAVAPGQHELDAAAIGRLGELTASLVDARRDEARVEYERFLSVIKRELCLPKERLAERLDGAVVLVTGGTGCVGSTLIAQLAPLRPARIVSVSRGVTRGWPKHPGAEYVYADVRDRTRLDALFGEIKPDLVFHVASQRDPGLAETLVHHTVTTNVLGARNVLAAAAAAGTGHVVCASTGKALRPFSPDIYTASKRVAEWVASGFAASGAQSCSAVRFTHVVDNSIIHQRLQDWAASSAVIRLHSPQIAFYVQSALESAQLLMLAALDTGPETPGRLPIRAISDLGWPVSLLDLTLGVLAARDSTAPIYLSGYDPGYEEVPFPGLYDPATAGELSPLLNAFEASAVVPSGCPMTDAFEAGFAPEPHAAELYGALAAVCDETDDPERVRAALRELSWALLDATLAVAPPEALARAARLASRHGETLTADHHQILQTIQNRTQRRSNLALLVSFILLVRFLLCCRAGDRWCTLRNRVKHC
jgi:nucleoside-diphosphate-sugar epimerase